MTEPNTTKSEAGKSIEQLEHKLQVARHREARAWRKHATLKECITRLNNAIRERNRQIQVLEKQNWELKTKLLQPSKQSRQSDT